MILQVCWVIMLILRNSLATFLAGALASAPAFAMQPSDYGTDTSKLVCKILGADGKPAEGVRLEAYHLSSERLYVSAPTKANGQCELTGLPYGYHDLAVETPAGLYVSSQVINIPPDGTASIVLTLLPLSATSPQRPFAGSEEVSTGEAKLVERIRGRAFWRSPRGIAVLAGSGGLALLLFAGGGGRSSSETPSSPF